MAGTIGYDGAASGSNYTSASAQSATTGAAFTYTAVANDVVSEVGFYCGGYTGDGTGVEVGVHDLTANGGAISGAPLVATGTITSITGNSRNSLAITPVALIAGRDYFVAVSVLSATNVSLQRTYVSGSATLSTFDGTSPLQATWTSGAASGNRTSIFATVTTAAPSGSDSNPITLASSASEQTVQAMVATSVTAAGSVFDSSMIAVEDNMQVTAPLTVAPATYFTIAADGTYTHDADTTIVVPLKFYSPTTKQLSYAEMTLEGIAATIAPIMPATATRNVAQPNQLMGVYATSNTPDPAVTYTLTGTDAGLLSINGSTGAVTANSPTSVAGKSSYSFNVVATNIAGTDTTAVTVTIVAVVARNMTEWIEANGEGGQTNEAWLKYMLGAGASGKTFNDLMFDWLGILGYTGSLTERVAKWNEANLG